MRLEGASVNPVEASGRITLREHQLDELEESVVLTQGFDGNILMMSPEQWGPFRDRLLEGPLMDPEVDDLRRLFLGAATEVMLDDRGRVKIPEPLRQWAGLAPGRSRARVLNIGTRFEVWEERRYNAYMTRQRPAMKRAAKERFGGGGEREAGTDQE